MTRRGPISGSDLAGLLCDGWVSQPDKSGRAMVQRVVCNLINCILFVYAPTPLSPEINRKIGICLSKTRVIPIDRMTPAWESLGGRVSLGYRLKIG